MGGGNNSCVTPGPGKEKTGQTIISTKLIEGFPRHPSVNSNTVSFINGGVP